MSDTAAPDRRKRAAQVATPMLVIAGIVVVIVLDPLGNLVGTIDFSWISLPDMPGWIQWIGDLPGPGFLIIIFVLIALGEAGRRGKAQARGRAMIEARDLHKRYGAAVAVDGLTFDITPGLVTGFLGPNGAGKSTTLRMILGLDRPTQGTVTVAGRAYRDLPAPMHEVGALLDAKAVHGKRTRAPAPALARAGRRPARDARRRGARRGRPDARWRAGAIGGFSLGMAQRLGIAAALLGDPRTLLFDEPVNGLDPEGIRWIRTLMRRLAAEGRTVVVSSHLMNEMEETADHVLVIGRGRLIADTSMAEFRRRSASSHVHVVSPDAARPARAARARRRRGAAAGAGEPSATPALTVSGLEAARIGDLAAEHGLRVHELTPRSASLETAFMELTHDSVDYRPAGVA